METIKETLNTWEFVTNYAWVPLAILLIIFLLYFSYQFLKPKQRKGESK